MKETQAKKAVDNRIQKAYGQACANVQVGIMDIPKIFRVGRDAIEAGADDVALQLKIREFVETIRKN